LHRLAAHTAASISQTELAAKLKTAQANIGPSRKRRQHPSTTTLQRIAKATGHKLAIIFKKEP